MTVMYSVARLARSIVAAAVLITGVALGSAAVAAGQPGDSCTTAGGDGIQCSTPAAGEAEESPASTTLQPPGDPFFPIVPVG